MPCLQIRQPFFNTIETNMSCSGDELANKALTAAAGRPCLIKVVARHRSLLTSAKTARFINCLEHFNWKSSPD